MATETVSATKPAPLSAPRAVHTPLELLHPQTHPGTPMNEAQSAPAATIDTAAVYARIAKDATFELLELMEAAIDAQPTRSPDAASRLTRALLMRGATLANVALLANQNAGPFAEHWRDLFGHGHADLLETAGPAAYLAG